MASLSKLTALLLFFLLALSPAYAQQSVRITVNVLPPYSAYLQDYAGAGQQVRIFISNLSGREMNVRLLGTLTGDNGVTIRTAANYRPAFPLRLLPTDVNRLLTRTDLEGLFDLGQIEVEGMDRNLLYRGGSLPDGQYQLCVQAFDNATTRPLSAEFPLGCSALIPVKAIEPPILISPMADQEVSVHTPQTQVFTWTAPVGVSPAQVSYTLRIVELPDNDQDPNVFIDAVALPKSGLEVKNLKTTTFLYGPQHPPLTPGRRYAWRVQATDPFGKINLLNDGKSPVQAFSYGGKIASSSNQTDANQLIVLRPKFCGDTVSAGANNDLFLAWELESTLLVALTKVATTGISAEAAQEVTLNPGLLLNYFPQAHYNFTLTTDKGSLSRTSKFPFFREKFETLNLSPGKIYNFNVELVLPADVQQKAQPPQATFKKSCSFKYLRKDLNPSTQPLLVKGILKYRFSGENETFLLPKVRLRLFYVNKKEVSYKSPLGNNTSINTPNKIALEEKKGTTTSPNGQDETEIASSIVTDENGAYTFTVTDYDNKIEVPFDNDPADAAKRYLIIRVENNYFEPSKEQFKLPLGATPTSHTLPDLTLLARAYDLTVTASKTYANWPKLPEADQALKGKMVVIYRKAPPSTSTFLPPVEGMINRTQLPAQNGTVSASLAGNTATTNSSLAVGNTKDLSSSGVGNAKNLSLPAGNTTTNAPLVVGNTTTSNFQASTTAPSGKQGANASSWKPSVDPYTAISPTTTPVSESSVKADLDNRGYLYVASGRLSMEEQQAVLRFQRLFYWRTGPDYYYIYCPELGQEPDDAVPFKETLAGAKPGSMSTPLNPDKANQETYTLNILSKQAPTASFKGRLLYQYPDPVDPDIKDVPPNAPKPLANVKVKLMMVYAIKNPKVTGHDNGSYGSTPGMYVVESDSYLKNIDPLNLHEKVLAVALTDKQGNFSFDVSMNQPYPLGLVQSNFQSHTGGGEFKTTVTGEVYRTLRVIVENYYYTSPSDDYGDLENERINPLGSYDLGTMMGGVISYGLSARFISDQSVGQSNGPGKPLQKIDVYVLKPLVSGSSDFSEGNKDAPYDEGQNLTQQFKDKSGATYRVIAHGLTNGEGIAKFNRLLNDTKYTIAALSNVTGQAATKDKVVSINEVVSTGGIHMIYESKDAPTYPWFRDQYHWRSFISTYDLKPDNPRVRIRAIDGTNPTQGIEGVTVNLYGIMAGGNAEILIGTGKTDVEGYCPVQSNIVLFNGKIPVLSSARLIMYKKGWVGTADEKTKVMLLGSSSVEIPGGLPLGFNYNDEFVFNPNALVVGRVVSADEEKVVNKVVEETNSMGLVVGAKVVQVTNKTPVSAYVQIGEQGSIVETEYDGTFRAPVPFDKDTYDAGKFPLIVHPKSAVYFYEEKPGRLPSDFSKDVKEKKFFSNIGDVPVYERSHRIKFTVLSNKGGSLPLSGARAYLLGDDKQPIGMTKGQAAVSDHSGIIEGRFKNVSVQNLYMEIRAKGYVTKTVSFTNTESKSTVDLGSFVLSTATTVSGTVVVKEALNIDFPSNGLEAKKLAPLAETPRPGAEVYASAGLGAEVFSTRSDANGNFNLEIPASLKGQQVKLYATYADAKSTQTYVGDEKKVKIAQAFSTDGVKLTLSTFNQFHIADIWGFPITITKLTQTKGDVYVSGEVLLDDNRFGPFRVLNPNQKITFSNARFIPNPANPKQGIPFNKEVDLDVSQLPKTAYMDAAGEKLYYNVHLSAPDSEPSQGVNKDPFYFVYLQNNLQITKREKSTSSTNVKDTKPSSSMLQPGTSSIGLTNSGFIRAKAQIVDNSFSFPSSLLSYAQDQFYLSDPSAPDAKPKAPTVLAFNSSGSPRRSDFHLSKQDGSPMTFNLITFGATSKPEKSLLKGPEIWIGPDMTCQIPNAQPNQITVSIDKLVLKSSTIEAQTGNGPLKFALGGKWSVEVNNWTLDYKQGGFYYAYASSGQVQGARIVTGKVDVPLKEFVLRKDRLVLEPLLTSSIPLAGVTNLTVMGKQFFGYDTRTGSDQKGHWSMVVVPDKQGTPAARIPGGQLHGVNNDLDFGIFSMLDNGEDNLSLASKTINFNGLLAFSPSSIDTGPDYLALVGSGSLDIPRIDKNLPMRMVYTQKKKGQSPDLSFVKPFAFEGKGYVQFKNTLDKTGNPDIRFKDGVMVMGGTVEEPGELNPIQVQLVHTKNFTRITHERTETDPDELAKKTTWITRIGNRPTKAFPSAAVIS
jgi:hypothetical protein